VSTVDFVYRPALAIALLAKKPIPHGVGFI
jgi:hypothetical protein